MKSKFAIIAIVSFVISLGYSPISHATLVSQSLGQAGEKIITSRELAINQMIEKVFAATESTKAHGDATIDLSNLLLEKVLSLESATFAVGSATKAEVQDLIEKTEKAYASNESWSKLEVGKSELEVAVREKLEAKKFLKFKANSLQTEVSDDEARLYFEKNRIKFGNLPFESFKDNIKSFMNQQQLEEKLKAWFEVVKRKYKVKVFANSGIGAEVGAKASESKPSEASGKK